MPIPAYSPAVTQARRRLLPPPNSTSTPKRRRAASPPKLYIADPRRLRQRHHRLALWNELLPHPTLVPRRHNRLHDRRIIQFLRLINFISTWHAARVVVPEVLMIPL